MLKTPYQLLLVDDNEGVQEIVEISIREEFPEDKLNIVLKTSANDALEYVKNNPVHIVLTDIHMQGSFGDSLLRECNSLNKGIQTIVMTGDTKFTTVSNCFLDGARFYIVKPFTNDQINNAVQACIDQLDHWAAIFGNRIVATSGK